MKNIYLLLILLTSSITAYSIESKTIDVPVAGKLASKLSNKEQRTITNLTITGHLDARDFYTLWDRLPLLNYLDISKVFIDEYVGKESKYADATIYPANTIPAHAFYGYTDDSMEQIGKTTLTRIILPETLKGIGEYAFADCSGLCGQLVIPETVTSIGESAFNGCTGLIGQLAIPNSVKSIGNFAFQWCSGFSSLSIPNTITTIPEAAFEGCSGLVDTLYLPSSIISIGDYAFQQCSGLSSISIPDSVTYIGQRAFYDCIGLIGQIVIPNRVTTIKQGAFNGCSSIISVVIPASITSIEADAFNNCTSMVEIVVQTKDPKNILLDNSTSPFTGVDKSTCILYVPAGSKIAYKACNVWKEFKNIDEVEEVNPTK